MITIVRIQDVGFLCRLSLSWKTWRNNADTRVVNTHKGSSERWKVRSVNSNEGKCCIDSRRARFSESWASFIHPARRGTAALFVTAGHLCQRFSCSYARCGSCGSCRPLTVKLNLALSQIPAYLFSIDPTRLEPDRSHSQHGAVTVLLFRISKIFRNWFLSRFYLFIFIFYFFAIS